MYRKGQHSVLTLFLLIHIQLSTNFLKKNLRYPVTIKIA